MHVPGQSIRVLHVDDDPDVAETAGIFLEKLDERFDVETASDASEGLDRIAADRFDCVVSDFDMPGRNGIEFLEAVRDTHPNLPFILYTGKGSEEVASEAISAGVTDYLQKDVGSSQYTVLANRIRNAVERTRQKRRIGTLIENLPGMVYRCRNEPGWPMDQVNGDVESLTGYTPSEIEGGDGVYGGQIVHSDDREDVWNAVQEAVPGRDSFELTYRIVTKSGTTKWVWERGQMVSPGEEAPAVLEGFVTDITEREEARRELEREREFVQQALDTLEDLFYVVGPDGELRRWNARVTEVTGYTDDELDALQAIDLFPEDEHDGVVAAIEETMTTGRAVAELELLTKDGRRLPYEFTGSRLTDTDGIPTGLVGVGRDISERST